MSGSMHLSRRAFVRLAALSAGVTLLPPVRRTTADPPSAPIDFQDWEAVRELFELSPDLVQAALFFLASHPRPVRQAVEEYRRQLDANPIDAVEHGALIPDEANLIVRATGAVARYIGADPDDVALANSTTHGLAVAYQGLRLGPGDEILTTAHDHYSQLETVRLVCERTGAARRQLRLFAGHDASGATVDGIVERIRAAIAPSTRVLGITWVHSSSGLKMPLSAVAAALREINAGRQPNQRVLLLVDGVHGLGADDPAIAATGVDIFVSGLHKWMFAPRGTGFVWARPEVWEQMLPMVVSYTSLDPYFAWLEGRPAPRPPRASFFGPGGFQAYEHLWAITAAVEMHEAIGPQRVRQRILSLNDRARKALATMPHVQLRTPRDAALVSGITAFEVDGHLPEDAVHGLRDRGIVASTSPYRPTYVRLSFGLANSEADVDAAVAAVATLR